MRTLFIIASSAHELCAGAAEIVCENVSESSDLCEVMIGGLLHEDATTRPESLIAGAYECPALM